MKAVVADFDHTLVKTDTLMPFLSWVLRETNRTSASRWLVAIYLAHRLGFCPVEQFKRKAAQRVFRHQAVRDIEGLVERFYATQVQPQLHRSLGERIRDEVQGGPVLVLTTNFEILARPLQREFPNLEIVGNQLGETNGVYTGEVSRWITSSQDKLKALQLRFPPGGELRLSGYGDSPTDAAFMMRCQEAHWLRDQRGRWRRKWHGAVQLWRGECDSAWPDEMFQLEPLLR